MTSSSSALGATIMPINARALVISGEGGRKLLTLHPNGRVEADLADCDEAAKRFVACLVPCWADAMQHKHGATA